jgi:hypothetical protein
MPTAGSADTLETHMARKKSKFPYTDFYQTPIRALVPLIPYLPEGCCFAEPCAGRGRLAYLLVELGHQCVYVGDLQFSGDDALAKLDYAPWCKDYLIVTNPPFSKKVAMLRHFLRTGRVVWLLLPTDWKYTGEAGPFMRYCFREVPITRVKWFSDTPDRSAQNYAWFGFQRDYRGPWAPFVPAVQEIQLLDFLHPKDPTDEELREAYPKLWLEEWLAVRKAEAKKIDPRTAEVYFRHMGVCDPYGVLGDKIPDYARWQSRRTYFARRPDSDISVWFGDLPEETQDALWQAHKQELAFPAGVFPPTTETDTELPDCV